ncbi:tachykinin-like peptides receptor 86C [Oscarella lobularis]|uniref:tachykinin-like peptides receptor 86C n=1 Tax=Oscarella lobularis TaxID=121494 RepID=UPI003313F662
MSGYDHWQHYMYNETFNGTNRSYSNYGGGTLIFSPGTAKVVLSLSVGIFTVIMCGLIFIVQIKRNGFREVSTFVLLNSIAADLVSGCCVITTTLVIGQVFPNTPSYDGLCKFMVALYYFTGGWSAWAVFFVAFDRYDAVANGMRRKFSLKKAIICVIVSAFAAALFALFPLTSWGTFQARLYVFPGQEKVGLCVPFTSWKGHSLLIYGILYFTFKSYLPQFLTVISLSLLVVIAWRVLRAQRDRERTHGEENPNRSVITLLKSRGFKYIVAVIICKLICTMPVQTGQLGTTARTFRFPEKAYYAVDILHEANFVINSILYFLWLTSLNRNPNDNSAESCCTFLGLSRVFRRQINRAASYHHTRRQSQSQQTKTTTEINNKLYTGQEVEN